ncbi:MAG: hypothetical protein LC732_05970 [Acidobacteria bacterium]|nr:hypothetical protein [Acidobacteriota bacterium]
MNDKAQVHHHDTRELARKFNAYPTPLLKIANLRKRWDCSRSAVDRFRKEFGLRSDGPEDGHPLFDLLSILKLEDVSDPLLAWALGTADDRKVLAADPLTIDDLVLLDRSIGGHDPETFRRRARAGKQPGFKIGRQWLFRPSIEDLERLEEIREASEAGQ